MKTIKIIPVLMGVCVAFGAANSFGAQNAGFTNTSAVQSGTGTAQQKMNTTSKASSSKGGAVIDNTSKASSSKGGAVIDNTSKASDKSGDKSGSTNIKPINNGGVNIISNSDLNKVNLVNLKITDGKCKMGNCNACKTAEEKCKCIATTYFQYGPMSHQGATKHGEYTIVRDIYYTGGRCSFGFNHVHAVRDIDSKTARQLYGTGISDKMIQVSFPLEANSKISMTGCTRSDDPWDNNRYFADELLVNKVPVAQFKHCAQYPAGLTYAKGAKQPERGKDVGACYWCDLEDLHKQQTEKVHNGRIVPVSGSSANKKGGFVEL